METTPITKIDIITRQSKFDELKDALNEIGITGMTVYQVLGCGNQKGKTEVYRGNELTIDLLPKVKIEICVCEVPVQLVVDTAKRILNTGKIGDGKIFIYPVQNVIKIRTGEEGVKAL
nr:P-II family nitrogen regulator [uncultured Cellulosilyticum sp.]